MKMQIGRWGNSLAIRLPKELVDRFGLREGGEIDTAAIEAALQAGSDAARQERREAALRKLAERPLLPGDFRFRRDEFYGDDGRPV